MIRSYLQFRTFSRIGMRASIPRDSKRCNTNERSVPTAGEPTEINHIWSNVTIES